MNDNSHFAATYTGSNKQKQPAIIDSGSSLFTMNSTDCKTCHQNYSSNQNNSQSFKTYNKKYEISHGTGSIEDTISTDNFHTNDI